VFPSQLINLTHIHKLSWGAIRFTRIPGYFAFIPYDLFHEFCQLLDGDIFTSSYIEHDIANFILLFGRIEIIHQKYDSVCCIIYMEKFPIRISISP
jgi:hypothetical protein